ncbi:MAG TPA: alpha/beta fold hydrolase [Vineibacter sp.]|nr:alpha/beta fold hydrolase [Vineibacter sp.]
MERRDVLRVSAAVALAGATAATASAALARARSVTFVLVHGAWHGGWCWARLKPLLEAAGHRVTTPTLTGLGERRHLISRAVTLDTHIQDVISHIEAEELSDVVLVGHSYGGFVVCGAADRRPTAITQLVILDGFVPKDGEAVLDYAPTAAAYRENAARSESWNIPPLPASAFGIADPADADWVNRRLSPQPVGTYLQKLTLTGGIGSIARLAYISCSAPALAVLDETKQRIRADQRWRFVDMADGHDVMVTAPRRLSDVLLSLLV